MADLIVNYSVPSPKAVLFDWDNTLVDTWPVIHHAVNAVMRAFDREPWPLEKVRQEVRHSLRDTFPAAFGHRWREARDCYYQAFEKVHLEALHPIPGAETLLEALRFRGIPLAVVSNKTGYYLRREVNHLGWQAHFAALVGAGDSARDKPAPDPVHLALEACQQTAGPEVWFIGDTNVDMQIAHATGCTALLVGEEGQDILPPPHHHAADCAELYHFVQKLI